MTERQRVALDLDSTLAATSDVAFDLMHGPDHGYGYEDIESWAWGIERFGKERYLSAMWHAWTLRPLEVPLMEDGLPETIDRLQEDFIVDIVTAHPDQMGISKGKKQWLDHHGIPYNDFVVVDNSETKADLNYTYFIDDKPALPGEAGDDQTVFVRDHPYNRDMDADHVRVESVAEAVTRLGRETIQKGADLNR